MNTIQVTNKSCIDGYKNSFVNQAVLTELNFGFTNLGIETWDLTGMFASIPSLTTGNLSTQDNRPANGFSIANL
jgi:hypothetical protein